MLFRSEARAGTLVSDVILGMWERGQKITTEEYRAALASRPGYPDAYYNLGRAAQDQARLAEAAELYRRAVEFRPEYVEAANNLGVVLQELERWEESVAVLREAAKIRPDFPQTYNNLGNALQELGRMDEALDSYHRAVALQLADGADADRKSVV